MNKKLLIFGIISVLLLLGGCPIPLNVAICGNDVCESGEQDVCPGDCESVTETVPEQTCSDIGGDTCSSSEMCGGYWMNSAYTCCSQTCESDITSIEFKEGWNYISFPESQLNDNIEDIFSTDFLAAIDSIYTYYDGQWSAWHSDSSIPSDLTTIEGGRGYVFNMNSDYTLELSTIDAVIASSTSPHQLNVYTGWNLIGVTAGVEENREKSLHDYFTDLGSTYTSLWEYTTSTGSLGSVTVNGITVNGANYYYNLIPTHAYWIYVTSDGEITP